jgi:hypothetical protein
VWKALKLVVKGTGVTGASYLVLLVLAINADAANMCAISIAALALDAHLTKKSVTRALQYLMTPHGSDPRCLVTKIRRGRGVGFPNYYAIDVKFLREIGQRPRVPGAWTASRIATGVATTPAMHSATTGEPTSILGGDGAPLRLQKQDTQPVGPSIRARARERARIDAAVFRARIDEVSLPAKAGDVCVQTCDGAPLDPPPLNGCAGRHAPGSDNPGLPSNSSAAYARFPWPRR